jgi:hypothetical protein
LAAFPGAIRVGRLPGRGFICREVPHCRVEDVLDVPPNQPACVHSGLQQMTRDSVNQSSPVTTSADGPGIRLMPTAGTTKPGPGARVTGTSTISLGPGGQPFVPGLAGLLSMSCRAESDGVATPPKATRRHQTNTRLTATRIRAYSAQEPKSMPSSMGPTPYHIKHCNQTPGRLTSRSGLQAKDVQFY